MDVYSWVLVGFFSESICSLALAGRSVLRDSISSRAPDLIRSNRPTDLPFFPLDFLSSDMMSSRLLHGSNIPCGLSQKSGCSRLIDNHVDKNDPGSLKWPACPLGH